MEWSPETSSIWGKLDPATNTWLPLVAHLEHAAGMAGLLWDRFLPLSVKQWLVHDLAVSDVVARAVCCWLAGTHDVGKASPVFSCQAEKVAMHYVLDQMRDRGFQLTAITREVKIRHEVVSHLAMRDWLESQHGVGRRVANGWASVLGAHHGKPPTSLHLTAAEDRPDMLGQGRWSDARAEVLDVLAQHCGITPHLPTLMRSRLSLTAQSLLSAIVIVADWMASNQDYFPYHDELPPPERVALAFEQLGLPAPWSPSLPTADGVDFLRVRFPHLASADLRPIQAALIDEVTSCEVPGLFVVEARMGEGKTEAALLAAEVLAARFAVGGVFVGLPTMATANPMFGRVLDWMSTQDIGDASVALAHGKAGLNDRYAGLIRQSWSGHVYDDDNAHLGRPVVNSWLRGRRRAGLASFVVGTVDQGLFLALKAKHVALRHLSFAGKVVIIDEVHAADVYMREYLKRALEWFGAYTTPVILMSATLPPTQRNEYVAAYAKGRGDRSVVALKEDDRYPRLTVYDGVARDVCVRPAEGDLSMAVSYIDDGLDALGSELSARLADGGCAAVICNTVSRAQDAYRALRHSFGSEVLLVHSRFVAPERAARESDLVRRLGRSAEQRPQRLIVVGTQVLEQSLDVDFDVMVSDLAPIDLLLQRVGRLHRHDRPLRPLGARHPCLLLRGVMSWGASPTMPVAGSERVYGRSALLRAAAILGERHDLLIPGDIPGLVRAAYSLDATPPAGWEEKWAEAEQRALVQSHGAVARSRAYLLDDPGHAENLTGWIDVVAPDPDRSEEQGRSQVRDSEDSLEVIALWRGDDGLLRLPVCAPRHPGAVIPEGMEWGTGAEQALAREMATCTLSLPLQLTHPGVIDRVIGDLERSVDCSGWQQSPWLKGQLVLAFNADNRATLAGQTLVYTSDEGLDVTGEEAS